MKLASIMPRRCLTLLAIKIIKPHLAQGHKATGKVTKLKSLKAIVQRSCAKIGRWIIALQDPGSEPGVTNVLGHIPIETYILYAPNSITQPISPRVKWLGSRAEAVIFAEEFGLTAKDMNRSFIIPSRSGVHRNLSLSGDTPKYAKNLYPIWKAISDYKSVL